MATARRSFIEQCADTYLDELAKYGLDAPRETVSSGLRANIARAVSACVLLRGSDSRSRS